MPGISGRIESGDRAIERPDGLLAAFDKVHALRGAPFVRRVHVSRSCVIHNLLTGLLTDTLAQPVADPRGRAVLLLEGEVFNLDEVAPLVKDPFGSAPLEVLLGLFLEKGPDMAALLDGHFNIVIHEEKERMLTVISDRFASKPMYYREEGGGLLFGSEKKAILAASASAPRVDPLGLLQVIAHHHNLSGRTPIEGITRLAPSSFLRFREGHVEVRRYERMEFHVPPSPRRASDLIDDWIAGLRDDIARRLRGKTRVLISLSGGLDSRAMVCAFPRDFRPVWARTRAPADSLEFRCAAEIARCLGIDHFREHPADVPYSHFLSKAVWRTECEVNFTHCLSVAAHARMKEHGDHIFAGQSGAIVAGGHIYPYMLVPQSRESFLEKAFRRYVNNPEPILRSVFAREFLTRTMPLLKEAFIASFQPYEGANHDAMGVWNLLERQSRMTLSAAPIDSHLFEKVFGLLGRKYTDVGLSLPLRFRYGQGLRQAMIHHMAPEIRHVPYANTGLRLRPTVAGNLANKAIDLGRKCVRKALRTIGGGRSESQPADRNRLGDALRTDPGFRKIIEDFVRSDACDGSIFNGPGILSLLDAHCGGKVDRASLLCLVATFAVGIRYFVCERRSACPEEAQPVPSEIAASDAARGTAGSPD
jgi:asparagine synthetase B (glutamine-hydrolysing)